MQDVVIIELSSKAGFWGSSGEDQDYIPQYNPDPISYITDIEVSKTELPFIRKDY